MVKTISSSASSSKIPVPAWILRHHSPSSIHSISFTSNDPYPSNAQSSRSKSRKSKYVIASDSKGLVSIARLKDYRPIAFWKAHGKGLDADGSDKARRSEEDSPVLGVEILKNGWILTHGRDNDLHIWTLPRSNPTSSKSNQEILSLPPSPLPSALLESLIKPIKMCSLKTNSLNFCRFSCILLPKEKQEDKGKQNESERNHLLNGFDVEKRADKNTNDRVYSDESLLLAVPNTLKAEWIDIYHLPSGKRIHEAIGREQLAKSSEASKLSSSSNISPSKKSTVEDAEDVEEVIGSESARVAADKAKQASSGGEMKVQKWGITMSLHLFVHASSSSTPKALHLLAGYEDGSVSLLCFTKGEKWEKIWRRKGHTEPVMSMTCSPLHNIAFSVSADEKIVRYNLFPSADETSDPDKTSKDETSQTFETKHAGRSTVDLSMDGKVLAVGGWDGSVRLHSARSSTLKGLGSLKYHKDSVQALSFHHEDEGSSLRLDDLDAGTLKGEEVKSVDEVEGKDEVESDSESESDSEDEGQDTEETGNTNSRNKDYLAVGGKDGRISIWKLDFKRK